MKSYHDIVGDGGSKILEQVQDQAARLKQNLSGVKHVVAVASGKGGVGKSSIAAGLALTWAQRGLSVGVIDADLHGSSVGRLFGMTGVRLAFSQKARVKPCEGPMGLRLMSIDFLQDPAGPLRWKNVPVGDEFVWRATLEMSLLREFLTDVAWDALDVLILDVPPGSDRLANLASFFEGDRISLALVTAPSGLSQGIVEKSFHAAREKNLAVKGLIENMKGYLCAGCETVQPLFSGDAADFAKKLKMPYLGGVPFDPEWSRLGDAGELWDTARWHEPITKSFDHLSRQICP